MDIYKLNTDKGFRKFYSYTYNDFKSELINQVHKYHLHRRVMAQLRLYANMFNRDMRKVLINAHSVCNTCSSNIDLTIDHIIPISKNGKNELYNVQILCAKCNNEKRDKL